MNNLYETPKLYDIFYNRDKESPLRKHYENILKGKNIDRIFDCSIGTGNLTYVLADMGYHISGSDISEDMLKIAAEKSKKRNIKIDLLQSDFRTIDQNVHGKYDCIMSTGNSLPHVTNLDVKSTLQAMTNLLKSEGYLYIDIRNWDRILSNKERFNVYDPVIKEDERINVILVKDYFEDHIDFNFLYTFEKNNRIYRKEESKVKYYPLQKEYLFKVLESIGYENIELYNFINHDVKEFEEMGWYSIICRLKK